MTDPSASWRNYQRVRFIKGFYRIRHIVQDLFDKYERSGDIAHEHIDSLLETHLGELRDLSDILFQLPDEEHLDRKRQRSFNKVMGELWHELDKTRDNIRIIEEYNEDTTPPDDKVFKALNRLDKQIVNQAKRDIPLQLRRAKRIVDILVPLFEQILPIYNPNNVVLRTLYFDRHEFDKLCQPSTVEYFFPILFDSVAEGYRFLIRDMLKTKHKDQAKRIYKEFGKWIKKNPKFAPLFEEAKQEFKSAI